MKNTLRRVIAAAAVALVAVASLAGAANTQLGGGPGEWPLKHAKPANK